MTITTSPKKLFDDHKHLAKTTLYRTLGQPHKVAKSKAVEFDDLLQVAYIGLWKACKTYNPKRGKFRTHAINNMRWNIIDALNNSFNIIKYPHNYGEKDRYKLTSIDAEIGHDEDSRNLHESIPDLDVDNEIENKVLYKINNELLLKHLDKTQQKIVQLKALGWTEEEIGRELGVTKQTINKRYNYILRKIKQLGESKSMSPFDLQYNRII